MIKPTIDISVVAANYNNGRFLVGFIESILNSTHLPAELIIIDDGSTDNSIEIISSYLQHGFIRLERFESNRGFAHALNKGIGISKGKYIARIDPDDIVLPDRFWKQFRFLEENPGIDVVGGNVIYFNNSTGKEITKSNFPAGHESISATFRKGDHGVQHPTVMARTEVLKRYQYNQDVYPAEDFDLFARMIKDGCVFANLSEPLNMMRVHPGSVSNMISYSTINITFNLRDKIFGDKSGKFRRVCYYIGIRNYRRYLAEKNRFLKTLFILISSIFLPGKALRKLNSIKLPPLKHLLFRNKTEGGINE